MVPSSSEGGYAVIPIRDALVSATQTVQAHLAAVGHALEHPTRRAQGAHDDQNLSLLLATADAHTLEWLASGRVDDPQRALGALRITGALRQIDRVLDELAERPSDWSAGMPELVEPLHHVFELALFQLAAIRDDLQAGDVSTALHVFDEATWLDCWHDVLTKDILEEMIDHSLSIESTERLLTISRALARISDQVREISENAVILAGGRIH